MSRIRPVTARPATQRTAPDLCKNVCIIIIIVVVISNLSNDRSKASSKTIPPHSAIYSFLLQLTVSSPVLKVIQ